MDQFWVGMVRLFKQVHACYLVMLCFVISVVAGVCASTSRFIRKKNKKKEKGLCSDEELESDWGAVKRVLVESVQWSGGKWVRIGDEEDPRTVGQERFLENVCGEVRYLEKKEEESPVSPLWQRRILMGERCELPRFSGLILYDEQGRLVPVHASDREAHCDKQVSSSPLNLHMHV